MTVQAPPLSLRSLAREVMASVGAARDGASVDFIAREMDRRIPPPLRDVALRQGLAAIVREIMRKDEERARDAALARAMEPVSAPRDASVKASYSRRDLRVGRRDEVPDNASAEASYPRDVVAAAGDPGQGAAARNASADASYPRRQELDRHTGHQSPDNNASAGGFVSATQDVPLLPAESGDRCEITELMRSQCGHCHPPVSPPAEEGLFAMIRKDIEDGADPDDVTDKITDSLGDASLASLVRPAIRRIAVSEERRITRRTEHAARIGGSDRISRETQDARLRLPKVTFKLPDGQRVTWREAKAWQHEARVAWMDASIVTQELDRDAHLAALKLMAEEGADCLGDIPDWTDRIGHVPGDEKADEEPAA